MRFVRLGTFGTKQHRSGTLEVFARQILDLGEKVLGLDGGARLVQRVEENLKQ